MIQEAYVSFEVAKLLKEKGFDTLCDWAYNNKEGLFEVRDNPYENIYCYKPTQQMTMRWLREEKNISIIITFDVTRRGYCPYVYIKDYDCDWVSKWNINLPYKYEEAVEAALKYVLENLI